MESTHKFDCWEELSDEELASISGGTPGVDLIVSGSLGNVTVSGGSSGASVGSQGDLGYVTVDVSKNGITSSSNGPTGIQKDVSIGK